MDLPQRKRIRLENFDYSSPGAYFVTICAQEKQNLFWQIYPEDSAGAATSRPPNAVLLPMALTNYGAIVDRAIQNISQFYPDVSVDRYVIMPNHTHILLRFRPRAAISRPYDLSTIVGQMKRWASAKAKRSLWQRSYYDHVIRNEDDYREIWNYIDANPVRWREDCFYTEQ